MEQQILFDMHTHSTHSHDSRCKMEDMCLAAINAGLRGIAVTDHCDVELCLYDSNYANVLRSAAEAKNLAERFEGRLDVIPGIEIGNPQWNPKMTEKVLSHDCFDVVLGSIHSVAYENYSMAFSRVDFEGWQKEELAAFMTLYFTHMIEITENFDFDILTHLTIPLRYINGRYGHGYSIEPHYPAIERILKNIIDRGIALEVNTSSYAAFGTPIPDETVLRLYKRLGGSLITVGSDAHVAINVASNFKRTLELIKVCGFDKYVYMKDKKFIPVNII